MRKRGLWLSSLADYNYFSSLDDIYISDTDKIARTENRRYNQRTNSPATEERSIPSCQKFYTINGLEPAQYAM